MHFFPERVFPFCLDFLLSESKQTLWNFFHWGEKSTFQSNPTETAAFGASNLKLRLQIIPKLQS